MIFLFFVSPEKSPLDISLKYQILSMHLKTCWIMSLALFLSRQLLVTWISAKSLCAGTPTHWKCPPTESEFKHRRKGDVNRVRHFKTSRQKKLFSLAECFLHFFVIGIPDLLSNIFAFREAGLRHRSWIFFFPLPQMICSYHSSDLPALAAYTLGVAT